MPFMREINLRKLTYRPSPSSPGWPGSLQGWEYLALRSHSRLCAVALVPGRAVVICAELVAARTLHTIIMSTMLV